MTARSLKLDLVRKLDDFRWLKPPNDREVIETPKEGVLPLSAEQLKQLNDREVFDSHPKFSALHPKSAQHYPQQRQFCAFLYGKLLIF